MTEQFEKYERALKYTLERINDEMTFVFHYVASTFCPNSSFSALDFQVNAHTNPCGTSQMAVRFSDLFQVEVKPNDIGVFKFPWPPLYCFYSKPKQREKVIMLGVSSNILSPLCREVVLESSYWEILKEQMTTELDCGDLGMGSLDTWHGTPDVRVKGVEVVYRKETEKHMLDANDGESESLASATATTEGNINIRDANLHQAIGTCVISSFTEKSLHPNKQAMVPTILIGEAQFRVCLYDCEKDVLLVSNSKSLATKDGLSGSGIALLWTVINHR